METLFATGPVRRFINPKAVHELGIPVESMENALECVCANGRMSTAAESVRNAPLQAGNWTGPQTFLEAKLAQPRLSEYSVINKNARLWDLESGKIQMRGTRTVHQIGRACHDYQPVWVEPAPEKQLSRSMRWARASKRKKKREELKAKRTKDTQPFRVDLNRAKPTPQSDRWWWRRLGDQREGGAAGQPRQPAVQNPQRCRLGLCRWPHRYTKSDLRTSGQHGKTG